MKSKTEDPAYVPITAWRKPSSAIRTIHGKTNYRKWCESECERLPDSIVLTNELGMVCVARHINAIRGIYGKDMNP